MARSGGARMIAQSAFTPVELAKQMQKLGLEPQALANAAERARDCGRPDAARDLADLVERMGRTPAFVGAEEVALRPVPTGGARSEERRVGKECGSTCRSRWSP